MTEYIFDYDAGAGSAESALCNGGSDWRPFPTELLPVEAATYVRAEAAAIGCDEALIALPVLVVLGAAVGTSARIRLKSSWEEPSTLWGAVVSPSGTQKSPALHAALGPVNAIESRFRREYESALAFHEEELAAIRANGKKATSANISAPIQRRVRLSDVTLEGAGLLHMQNPRGLLLARDELAGWIGSFDKYSRGDSDLQGWIDLYEDRPLFVDRKTGSTPSLSVEHPSVCVIGTVQPSVLARKLSEKHVASGFLARLLLAFPPERTRRWSESDVGGAVSGGYTELVSSLYARSTAEPSILVLDSTARSTWIDFYNEHASHIQMEPDGALRSAFSKLEAVAARLALVFTLCESPSQTGGHISAEAMQRATDLVRWFRHETTRVYAVLETVGLRASRDGRLVSALPADFTWQDISTTWNVEKRQAHNIIKRLESEGRIEQTGYGRYTKCTALSALPALKLGDGGGTESIPFTDSSTVRSRSCLKGPVAPAASPVSHGRYRTLCGSSRSSWDAWRTLCASLTSTPTNSSGSPTRSPRPRTRPVRPSSNRRSSRAWRSWSGSPGQTVITTTPHEPTPPTN